MTTRTGWLLAVLLLAVTACGSQSNDIGRWREVVLNKKGDAQRWGDRSLEILKDHSCIVHEPADQLGCRWSQLEDGRVRLEAQMMGISLVFLGHIKGDSADFTDPNNELLHFVRVGSGSEARLGEQIHGFELNDAGLKLAKGGHYGEAARKYRAAMKLGNALAYANLALLCSTGKGVEKDVKRARALWKKSAELGNTGAYADLGVSLEQTGDYKQAVAAYEKGVQKRDALAENDLAWILATCKDAALRDGKRAVKLASDAVKQDGDSFFNWGTLAAAYARDGQFNKAVSTELHAIDLVRQIFLWNANTQKYWTQEQHFLDAYQHKRAVEDACGG